MLYLVVPALSLGVLRCWATVEGRSPNNMPTTWCTGDKENCSGLDLHLSPDSSLSGQVPLKGPTWMTRSVGSLKGHEMTMARIYPLLNLPTSGFHDNVSRSVYAHAIASHCGLDPPPPELCTQANNLAFFQWRNSSFLLCHLWGIVSWCKQATCGVCDEW